MANTPENINTGNGDNKWSLWYVLTTRNPKHLEDLVNQENATNECQYECYCPFTSLPLEETKANNDESYSLRAALRRYVFVRFSRSLEEQHFFATISEWSHSSADSIFFLRNGDGDKARVSNTQLNIMKAHCDSVLIKPESLSVGDLRVGQKINLSKTPFGESNQEGTIQSVKRKRGGMVELRIEVTLFNVKFSNLLITFENNDGGSSSRLVYDSQQKLLAIYRRKVNAKETEASRKHDDQMLQDILRTANLAFPDGAMKRHHLALMLICARLMDNADALRQFTGMVKGQLAELAPLRESKAATDSRAWLHIALFIATGEPQYRDLAKSYIRIHNPKSTYLIQFVKQSCKTAGERWIGVKKKRK